MARQWNFSHSHFGESLSFHAPSQGDGVGEEENSRSGITGAARLRGQKTGLLGHRGSWRRRRGRRRTGEVMDTERVGGGGGGLAKVAKVEIRKMHGGCTGRNMTRK